MISVSDEQKNWLDEWLRAQHEWLAKLNAAAGERTEQGWRENFEAFLGSLLSTGRQANSWFEKIQAFMQGSLAMGDPPHEAGGGQDFSQTWRQFLHAFPLGQAREQQAAWQTLARAAEEFQAVGLQVQQAFAKVIEASLQSVPDEVQRMTAAGKPLGGYRELYDLWIEAGEREFAKLAHDAAFAQLQARFATAQLELRRSQQRVVEHALQQLDLPTRAELNTLHQRVRTLTARVEELERAAANAASAASSRPARKPRKTAGVTPPP